MRLKICPTKESIKNILTERIGTEQRLLAEEETELARLTAKDQMVYNPYNENVITSTKSSIHSRTEYIRDRTLELGLLDAHEAAKCMVEIEL